jgi:hypothetical protein
MESPGMPMTLEQFIAREVKLVKESRQPNAISMRFVQLHEQDRRNEFEQKEYDTLYSLMRSRWHWYKASLDGAEPYH